MYLTGFADEAADDIDGQIRVTKELGWQNIESRSINGRNIHDISDQEFEIVYRKLQDSGIKINCFGSSIANHGKKITEPFDSSLEEAACAIPRMQRLGTKLIRIMSFAVIPNCEPDEQMEQERFKRLRILQKMFSDAGITAVHENCMNYGGMGWSYTLKLIENVPGLKLVFDTGNPVFSDDYTKPKPRPKQNALEFFRKVKPHVVYMHIKDGVWEVDSNGIGKCRFKFPGQGQGYVLEILKELFAAGYDGGISIEPHLGSVFHDPSIKTETEARYKNYFEYGKKIEIMIARIQSQKIIQSF